MVNNLQPLIVVLMFLFIVSSALQLTIGSIVDLQIPNPESALTDNVLYDIVYESFSRNFIGLIDTETEVFGFNLYIPYLNPFALFGDLVQNYVVERIVILTYLPDYILIPYLMFLLLAILWVSVKLILP